MLLVPDWKASLRRQPLLHSSPLVAASSMRMRPAHTAGPTFLCYTPNGRKLVTVGSNNTIRVFETGSDAEPTNIDDAQESNTAIAATNDFFITASEDGSVCKYSLTTNSLDSVLVRCSLPIRALAISPDAEWVAVCSDELVVKLVRIRDMNDVIYLRDQKRSSKHVSFDPTGRFLSLSCTGGAIYHYSLLTTPPTLVKEVHDLISPLDPESQKSSQVVWHPDARAFVVPMSTRDLQVVSADFTREKAFKDGHAGDVTALAWSPNGAFLVSAGMDSKICLWSAESQKVVHSISDVSAPLWDFSWHPTKNILSYTTGNGELYIHTNFVPETMEKLLYLDLQAAPFIHDPLSKATRVDRPRTPDSLDDILGPDSEDDFVEDDDGFGYAENKKKRKAEYDDGNKELPAKRQNTQPSKVHETFQPGSTPWRGNRKYLCLNLVGAVWTVDQETHRTVTVEFYDRELQRDFHFTDTNLYDKACLNEQGTLLSSRAKENQLATVFFRPHETWTRRTDWFTTLPSGEQVVSIALGDSRIIVATSMGYIRVFTLFGIPVQVYKHKSTPIVTCASWRDYVMIVSNGTLDSSGRPQLMYSIENLKRDEIYQSEDLVAASELKNVFFSDDGNPYIYDSHGVLLVLQHWRSKGQARWVPVLDTRLLERLASGRREETYWPVAVSDSKFYCIVLKGGEQYPYFPRPLLTDFDLCIPIGKDARTEQYVRLSVLHSLDEDLVAVTTATSMQKAQVARRGLEIDKTLLQLLAAECVEGEETGMRALEIVSLMRDRTGQMLDAAGKIAARYGRELLGEKIRDLAERRLVGWDEQT